MTSFNIESAIMDDQDPFDKFAEKMAKVATNEVNEKSNLFSSTNEIDVRKDTDLDRVAEMYLQAVASAKAMNQAKKHLKEYLTELVAMRAPIQGTGSAEIESDRYRIQATKSAQYSFDEKLALEDMDAGKNLPSCVKRKLNMTTSEIAKIDQQSFDQLRKYLTQKPDKTEIEVFEK
jgi:hypothetical protein